MNEDKYKNYLNDLGILTKDYARAAIADHRASKDDDGFKSGYMMAFHRVVTLMQQQAEAFDLPLNEIGLADIEENEFLQ